MRRTSSPKIAETMLAFLRGEPVADQRIVLPPVRLVPPREKIELAQSVLERYAGSYRINEKEVREVILEGGQLFTRRGEGRNTDAPGVSASLVDSRKRLIR